MNKNRRAGLSKKFIISLSLIFSALIIFTAALYNQIITGNINVMKESLIDNSEALMFEKCRLAVSVLESKNAAKNNIGAVLKEACPEHLGFLHAVVYSKTQDENYFKVLDIVSIADLGLNLEKGTVVKEDKGTNYLKKALLRETVDPAIYSRQALSWHSLYFPYSAGKQKLVIQFMISSSSTNSQIEKYIESVNRQRLIMVLVTSALVLAVIIVLGIFIQNYNLLLKKLSETFKKAAGGELAVSMNENSSKEMTELAASFNILMDEMKGIKDKARKDTESDLFRLGVERLKAGNIEESESLFKAFAMIKPENFAGFFNLGVIYAKMKNYVSALEMLEKAYSINPSHEQTKKYIEKIRNIIARNGQ